ncbi:MAG: type II toxin-antitoxin system HicB family antitoxin [Cyanomargarita calcarea GSE-NOS-MK-12-04C]|jgi:predicted RNase H-like HicB family nuclease|uniref:Type II toxin-antitoxin system HicB family antitoxin n=1 Tax=Cyanomargarita calcarea GSE-NOS-MK-12-04C TaxID=2839659 RepID=A0A951QIK4_9CYAN|nr:type II toxin-antitoxin system HicB family antitoxin [Cyanomargarita calcarea GSE-NOS-MK-12-04C]
MILRYEIILHWSEEDQAFIAEVPELPGCAADGETYQEALQNVEVIMQEWIETADELGRAIPQPKRRLMSA